MDDDELLPAARIKKTEVVGFNSKVDVLGKVTSSLHYFERIQFAGNYSNYKSGTRLKTLRFTLIAGSWQKTCG